MSLSIKQVELIAELARLKINENEIQRFQEQLSEILDYAARLQQVDTSGIPATARISNAESILREDTPLPGLAIAQLVRNAPGIEDDQFRVPPVLD